LKFVDRDPDSPFPSWLADSQKAVATSEWRKRSAVDTAPNYLTGQVLAYAKQYPQNPRVPQALYLAVRSTRLGCTNVENQQAFQSRFRLPA